MKKIDFKNYNTQNTIGVILMITSFVLFICLQVYALQSIYGIAGTVESIGKDQALQQINTAESIITFSRTLSAFLLLSGILLVVNAFRSRRKT